MLIPFIKTHEAAKEPYRATDKAAGWDVYATSVEVDREYNAVIYGTGLSVELPVGHYLDLRPRSSVYKTQWILANGCGVIDADYRGEVKVVFKPLDPMVDVRDSDTHPYKVGDRIAQFILMKHQVQEYQEAQVLQETERDDGGFGSTGKKGGKK